MDLLIRLAQKADACGLAVLMGQLGYPHSEEWTAERLGHFSGAACTIWVAVRSELVLGFVVLQCFEFFHEEGMVARISAMAVDGSNRREGIGKALLAAVEDDALRQGCSMLEVTSSLKRGDAHAFYRDLGFEENSTKYLKRLRNELK